MPLSLAIYFTVILWNRHPHLWSREDPWAIKYTLGLCLRPWKLRGDIKSPQSWSLLMISYDFLVTGGGRENPGSNAVNIPCMIWWSAVTQINSKILSPRLSLSYYQHLENMFLRQPGRGKGVSAVRQLHFSTQVFFTFFALWDLLLDSVSCKAPAGICWVRARSRPRDCRWRHWWAYSTNTAGISEWVRPGQRRL